MLDGLENHIRFLLAMGWLLVFSVFVFVIIYVVEKKMQKKKDTGEQEFSVLIGQILYTTADKNKAAKAEEELKKSGYRSIITEYRRGIYVVRGME